MLWRFDSLSDYKIGLVETIPILWKWLRLWPFLGTFYKVWYNIFQGSFPGLRLINNLDFLVFKIIKVVCLVEIVKGIAFLLSISIFLMHYRTHLVTFHLLKRLNSWSFNFNFYITWKICSNSFRLHLVGRLFLWNWLSIFKHAFVYLLASTLVNDTNVRKWKCWNLFI